MLRIETATSLDPLLPEEFEFEVLGVYRHAMSLRTHHGELVTVASAIYGNGPNRILLFGAQHACERTGERNQKRGLSRIASEGGVAEGELGLLGIVPGARGRRQGEVLEFSGGPEVRLENAVRWTPLPLPPLPTPQRLRYAANALRVSLDRVPEVDHRSELERRGKKLPGALAELVGFGPGLTPAGDDFLVGFMAMRPDLISADVLRGLLHRTTFVAAQYLEFACQGRFAEYLLDLVRACFDGDGLYDKAERYLRLGATSGYDTLLGLIAALEFSSQRR